MQFKEREGSKSAHFLSSLGELRGAKEREGQNCAHFLSLFRTKLFIATEATEYAERRKYSVWFSDIRKYGYIGDGSQIVANVGIRSRGVRSQRREESEYFLGLKKYEVQDFNVGLFGFVLSKY
jgi:hypothetical protein